MGVLFYVTFGKESSESYLVDIPIGESRVHREPLIDREPLPVESIKQSLVTNNTTGFGYGTDR
jgi:hypothetical protein